MAQIKESDGQVTIAAGNDWIESGQGTILINNSGSEPAVRTILGEASLPLPLEVGDVVEVLGSSIAFVAGGVTAYPAADGGRSVLKDEGVITVAAGASTAIYGGQGTAMIDGVKVGLNNISYPFTVSVEAGGDPVTIQPLSSSFVVHEI